ncbi:MAG: replication initiator protein [Microviridae sp.]|nr:MAG: replication initiator protein [Microviridae sp.]
MLCKSPNYIKKVGGLTPCGQCLPFRINKVRKWTFRLMLEYLGSKEACWVTLTYNDEHLPHAYFDKTTSRIFEGTNQSGTLAPEHMQLFIKRLRRKLPKKIRFFYCGEYGDHTKRPHYHLCIFGVGKHWVDTIRSAWMNPDTKMPIGLIHITDLTPENIKYTCGYALKKMTKKTDFRLNGSYPEFIRCSQGIGKHSISKIAESLNCKSAQLYYLTQNDIPRTFTVMGKDYPIDRYTRTKILQFLNKEDHAKEHGEKRFKKEMQDLHQRALMAPKLRSQYPSKGFALEYQYKQENAQKILNATNRATMFLQAKEKTI